MVSPPRSSAGTIQEHLPTRYRLLRWSRQPNPRSRGDALDFGVIQAFENGLIGRVFQLPSNIQRIVDVHTGADEFYSQGGRPGRCQSSIHPTSNESIGNDICRCMSLRALMDRRHLVRRHAIRHGGLIHGQPQCSSVKYNVDESPP